MPPAFAGVTEPPGGSLGHAVTIPFAATSPITVHFPKQVRDQLKILAVQNNNTLHGLVAEAFNDVFAKYGKPEIAPAQAEHLE